MAFHWKSHNDIFKGPGIYHLTFAVSGRRPLLGELVALEHSRAYSRADFLSRSYIGGVERPLHIDENNPRQASRPMHIDENNPRQASRPLHIDENDPRQASLQSSRQGRFTSQLATTELSDFGYRVVAHLRELERRFEDPLSPPKSDADKRLQICCKQMMPEHLHVVVWVKADLGVSIRQIAQGFRIGVRKIAEEMGLCEREEGHILEVPYIRTLAHKGQLSRMVRYVHANPDNAWMRKLHPDLYTIRRSRVIAGLRFDTMGKERLLDYPDTSVIALPRALSPEQIAAAVEQALWDAQRGCVTYTAAINAGEKAVARAIREAGYPLVVLLLDGFPAEGTEAARFFHPGMAYHQACGEGRLFLMAPHPDNYLNPELMARTEAAIKAKDERKGYAYRPLPHSSTRWRMIAGNVMLALCAGQVQ